MFKIYWIDINEDFLNIKKKPYTISPTVPSINSYIKVMGKYMIIKSLIFDFDLCDGNEDMVVIAITKKLKRNKIYNIIRGKLKIF